MNVLSYNLWLTCLSLRVPPSKMERVQGFIDNLKENSNDLDVVALQEIFTFGGFSLFGGFTFNSDLRSLIKEEAEKIGYNCVLSDPPKMFMQDSGLMILTKHEVLEQENYIFKYASYSEYVVAKGILYALIKHSDRDEYLMTFAIHMDAHRDRSRREQIKEVVAFVKEKMRIIQKDRSDVINGENLRVTICGDYNTDSLHSKDSYSYLRDEMMNELEMKNVFGEDTNNHPITFPFPRLNNWCLDHIFVSDCEKSEHSYEVVQWKTLNEESIPISDHYGVKVKINY